MFTIYPGKLAETWILDSPVPWCDIFWVIDY